jgi:hypothetical protein
MRRFGFLLLCVAGCRPAETTLQPGPSARPAAPEAKQPLLDCLLTDDQILLVIQQGTIGDWKNTEPASRLRACRIAAASLHPKRDKQFLLARADNYFNYLEELMYGNVASNHDKVVDLLSMFEAFTKRVESLDMNSESDRAAVDQAIELLKSDSNRASAP